MYARIQTVGLLKALLPLGRPVHSGFSGKHSTHAAITLFTPIFTTVYSQVLMYTAEWTGASCRKRKCPNFETVAKGGFKPGLTRLQVWHSTAEPLHSSHATCWILWSTSSTHGGSFESQVHYFKKCTHKTKAGREAGPRQQMCSNLDWSRTTQTNPCSSYCYCFKYPAQKYHRVEHYG